MSNAKSIQDRIAQLLLDEQLPHHGFARVTAKSASLAFYKDWLEKDYAGEMSYLKRHLPFKEDPTRLMSEVKSAIVVTFPYFPHPQPMKEFPLQDAKVALYAKGEDYHFWIRRRLNGLIERLRSEFPNEGFASYTDSAPVLERDLAARAGLGWIGKNTCLIHPKRGSLFLIGEIYTTLALDEQGAALPDFCGTCTRCIDACPTDALVAPRELDARRCISYLTIESKEIPNEDLRTKMADWFFGCDICQTVCPWNIKLHGTAPAPDVQAQRPRLISELQLILTSSNSKLMKLFAGTPLVRAGGTGLKRNALLICASARLHELKPSIEGIATQSPLRPLADWVLDQLNVEPPF